MDKDYKFMQSYAELAIPKKDLVKGAYYIGTCRNAQIARWDGEKFWHWRPKWGSRFIESIHHREDEEVFDVFDAFLRIEDEWSVREIEIPEEDEKVGEE